MTTLEESIRSLRDALARPESTHGWNWTMRQRLTTVKEALQAESTATTQSWLEPRSCSLQRRREQLMGQLTDLAHAVLTSGHRGAVRVSLDRLVLDLEHHRQRVSDLVYDGVAQELGGSE